MGKQRVLSAQEIKDRAEMDALITKHGESLGDNKFEFNPGSSSSVGTEEMMQQTKEAGLAKSKEDYERLKTQPALSAQDLINQELSRTPEFKADLSFNRNKKEDLFNNRNKVVDNTPDDLDGDNSFDEVTNQNNEVIKANNMNTLQALNYSQLDKDTADKIEDLNKRIEKLDHNSSFFTAIADVFVDQKLDKNLKNKYANPAAMKDEIELLQAEKRKLEAPTTKIFTSLVNAKLEDFNKRVTDMVPSNTNAATDYFLRKSSLVSNSSDKDGGFWRNMASLGGFGVAGSVSNFLGAKEIASSFELARLSKRLETVKSIDELSEDDRDLLDAYDLYQSSLTLSQTRAAGIGKGVSESLPFMVQMLATDGVSTTVGKATEVGLRKALVKFGVRGIENKLVKQALTFAAKSGVPALTKSVTGAVTMPMTYGDMAKRYAGDINVERDEKGNITDASSRSKLVREIEGDITELKGGVQDADTKERIEELERYKLGLNKSVGESAYEAIAANTIEVLTEKVGGEYIAGKLSKLGFKMPKMYTGKYSQKLSDFNKAVGFQGIGPEYLEELMVTPLNATFVGDSKYSDLWDGQQQLNTLLTVAATSGLMSIPGAAMNASSRMRNPEFYKNRKQTLDKIREIQQANPTDLDNILNLNSNLNDVAKLTHTQDKLRKEGKIEEANLLGETLIYNQALKAFETGTHEEFIGALDEQINHKETPADAKANLIKVKSEVTQLKRTYDQFSKLPNISTIMALQTNKLLGRKGVEETDKKMSEIELDTKQDIVAYAQANNIEVPPFDMPTLFTRTFEDTVEQDKYNQFTDKLRQSGMTSINQYEALSTTKEMIGQLTSENRVLFNEQINPEFQKKLKIEQSLRQDINTSINRASGFFSMGESIEDAIENKDFEQIDAELNKVLNKYKGKLSDDKLASMKEEAELIITKKVMQDDMIRQAMIAEETSDKEEELVVNDVPEEVKEESQEILEEGDTEVEPLPDAIPVSSKETLIRTGNEISNLSKEITGEMTGEPELYFSLDNEQFFDDLPRQLSENLGDPKKQIIKDRVSNVARIMEDQTGKKPSFEEFMENAIESSSKQQAEEFFNVYTLGWELNDFPKVDYKKIYNKVFKPFEEAFSDLNDASFLEGTTPEQVYTETVKIVEAEEVKALPITGFNEVNVPIREMKNSGFSTITPDLKLGFLAVKYNQSVVDGEVKRVDDESELNNDSLIDFKRLLDPDKFNGGEQLNVGEVPQEIMSKVRITQYNPDGTKSSVIYSTWLQGKLITNPDFKNTDEYIGTVPMMAYDSEGVAVAFIHDTNWYNPTNVGPNNNDSLQTLNIQQGKENVLEFRKQVMLNGLNTITIDNKQGGVFTVLPKAKIITLTEANPQSVIVVAKQKGTAFVGPNTHFETANKVITNKDDLKPNTTYDLRRIGKDEQGRATYFALPVFNGTQVITDTQTYWTIPQNSFTTLGKVFQAYLKVNGFGYAEKRGQVMDLNTAENIISQTLAVTGYDLSSLKDLRLFFQQYTNNFVDKNNFDYNNIADIFFNKESLKYNKLAPNTSLNGLETNAKMIEIGEDNKVIPTGRNYTEYSRDTLTTNVKSFDIGTAEKPNYVTAIQPSITYKYNVPTETEVAPTSLSEVISAATQQAVQEFQDANPELNIISSAKNLLSGLGFNNEQEYDDLPATILDIRKIESMFTTTPGLTIMQEFQLVDFIFNSIASTVGFNYKDSISKEELLKAIKDKYNEIAGPSKADIQSMLNQLSELDSTKYPEVEKLKQDYITTLDIYAQIENNWSNIQDKALEKLYKYTGVKDGKLEEDKTTQDNESMREKEYSKTSLEENGKDKTSYRLRRFMAGIEDKTPNGQVKRGFLNVPTFVGFNDVYDTTVQILSSPVEIESNFDLMIKRLSEHTTAKPWINDLINKLQSADNQIKKEFVYNFAKHSLSMKFAMYSVDGRGNYNLKVYDTNAHEITRLIKDQWRSNFIFSPLVNKQDQSYNINKVHAQNLLDAYNSWGENPTIINTDTIKAWLGQFGIVLSKDAFDKLVTEGIYYNNRTITYDKMFTDNDTVFGLLNTYLKRIINTANTEFEENENNHPYTDMGGVLNALSLLESKYTNQTTTSSFRDNGKSVYAFTPPKFVTDRVLELKQYDPATGENKLVNSLQKLSLSQNSYVLDLLNIEPDFRNKFQVDHNGITALKQQGKKASPFSGITDLTNNDHDIAKLTGFQDTKQGTIKATVNQQGQVQAGGNGISMRMGRMFLPTMSDKSQMLMLSTGVFNFFADKRKSFEIDSEGKFEFTDTMKNLLFNQLVRPELKRIINFHSKVKSTNIKDYDNAAQIFNFIPALNAVTDSNGINIIELIANNPEKYNEEYIEEKFKGQFIDVVKTITDSKVDNKLKVWETNVERNGAGQVKSLKFFDSSYLNQVVATPGEKLSLAAYDFVLNSFISNANMFSIIAGDPAVYSQDKLFGGFKVDNALVQGAFKLYGKENLFKPSMNYKSFTKQMNSLLDNSSITQKMFDDITSKIKPMSYSGTLVDYTNLSKQIGVNIGKRLALLIAPGNKIADSKNEKYIQIFMKDMVHMSSNIAYKIELYYGQDKLDSVQPLLTEYDSASNSRKKAIRNILADKFPTLSDYFDIESTDAQEYTTANEHITVLEGQGRISSTILATVKDKIKLQKELEKAGKPLTKESLITKEELDIVFQPIKPVHTGQVIDEVQDIARTVYVKSSSFPLLPQFTVGRELNNLRKKLEELEDKYNMPVRASYQTANKVGAMNNPINAFNESSLANAESASLILDRNNFRIQQDVPFKSDMKKEDKVSMGTQIFKLLFGDGMLNQDGFVLDGKTMTGKELYKHFNENFGNLIAIKKKQLFNELELNLDGSPIDAQKSFTKLQDMLQREARDRGYPRQDIEALSAVTNEEGLVIPLYDANNNAYYDFKLPLWISSNSNRYEALLNAIVTNRIINQKLPGNAYVVGSEEGMKVSEDISLAGSRVIHVGNFQGGELKGVQNTDGVFTYSQVYVPSKFKDANGKLIDMYKKDKKGSYVYLTIGEKGEFRLKDDMITKDLLSMFSFRTPTSSHVSGSITEIAGILPPEMGDLMIVPKHFTKQKGLDYDVDKETAYTLWNRVMADGSIKILDSQDKTEILAEIEAKLADELVDLSEDNPFNNMMTAIFGDEYEQVIEDRFASKLVKIEQFSDKLEQKLLENEFVKVHKSVFSNSNPEVQKKINKVLSMDFAKTSADFIDKLNNENIDNSDFTILSDEYQKEKMGLGAAGKLAIGVYSNYVTFHGLSQQTDTPLRLTEEDEDGIVDKSFTIGNAKSDGIIGNEMTLDGERSIAEAFAEKQNTATDNEKEQILGRVNVNSTTINVDSLLTLLGFDKVSLKSGEKISLSYLFLSQPIMKDYVNMIENSKAITAEFIPNREETIINVLKAKYGATNLELDLSTQMTGDNLVNAITEQAESITGLQTSILDKFLELNIYAREIAGLQSILNTTDLGKSIAESNEKYNKLEKLAFNKFIENGASLIGDYQESRDYNPEIHIDYMRVGEVFIKPNTPQGHIVVNGIKTGNDLWNKYFLYNDKNVVKVMDGIFEIINAEEKSENKRIELKHDIMREIKKYFNSYDKAGIFTDKASVERERLFIDKEGHKSLARYLNELKMTEMKAIEGDSKKGVFGIKKNRLLNKFEFNLNSNGSPSLIKYNSTTSENFDEDYLYTAIAEMVVNNHKLPDMNGKPYTTKMLAADLVTYSFVEGGVQEATQFMKYIPIEYLETVGFTKVLQQFSPLRNPVTIGKALGVLDASGNSMDKIAFIKQYMQHNPEMATQYSKAEQANVFTGKTFSTTTLIVDGVETQQKKLESFDLVIPHTAGIDSYPKFVSVKAPTKLKRVQDKFGLFQHVGNGKYQRISILGMSGMNEYQLGNNNVVSLLDSVKPEIITVKPNRVTHEAKQVVDPFNIANGNINEVLTNIMNAKNLGKYSHLGKVAKFLLETDKSGMTLTIGDTSANGLPLAAGRTLFPEGVKAAIVIDNVTIASNDPAQMARVFIHEMIHGVTSRELAQYFDKRTGEQKVADLPPHISKLKRVFEATKKQLGPELQALIEKRKAHLQGELPSGTQYSSEDLEVTYAGTSIFEFVTTALTEPEFMARMNDIPFAQSGQSLLEAFRNVVTNILYALGIKLNVDGITYEALNATLEFISSENLMKLNNNQNKNTNFANTQNEYDANYIKQIEAELKAGMKPIKAEGFEGIEGFDIPLSDMIKLPSSEC